MVATFSPFLIVINTERELSRYEDDPDFAYYECYSVEIDDLEDSSEKVRNSLGAGNDRLMLV